MYVGIDAGINHCICIKDDDGKILNKFFINNSKNDYGKLTSLIDRTAKICIEDTGTYSLLIYSFLSKQGYDIKRINSFKAEKLRQFLNDNVKTDSKDAEFLADLRKIKDDFIIKDITNNIELKKLSRLYDFMVHYQSKVKNKLIDELFRVCPELKSKFSRKLSVTSLRLLEHFGVKGIQKNSFECLCKYSKDHMLGLHYSVIKKIKDAFTQTVGISKKDYINLNSLITLYFDNQNNIDNMVKKLKEMIDNSEYKNLLTLPGINVITASVIIGEIGNVMRFDNCKQIVKFAGLDVKITQSGSKRGHIVLSKRGNSRIRKTLFMTTLKFIGIKNKNKFKGFYERLKAKNKQSFTCISAVSRKILIWLYFEMVRCHTKKGYVHKVIYS